MLTKCVFALAFLPALFAAQQTAQTLPPIVDVSILVVDAAGKPLPEAEIARTFMVEHGKMLPQGLIKTDQQGRSTWKMQASQLPATYIVLDKDHTVGAIVVITEASLKAPVRLVLKPLAEVRFRPDIEDGFQPAVMTTSIGYPDARAIVVQSQEPGPYQIPEGGYELSIYTPDLVHFRKPFRARAGAKVDLGALPLKLSPIVRNWGKPALPVEFGEARGVSPSFKIEDLRGKWVLLDFWGYWCGPCTRISLPRCIEFYQSHPGLRDKFEILAIHESHKITTFKELDERNALTEKEVWKGRLPFPVLIDKDGRTTERYGIYGYPTVVLIDPEGKIVKNGNLTMLKEKLGVKG